MIAELTSANGELVNWLIFGVCMLLGFLVAGSISAFVMLARMLRDGFAAERESLPAARLLANLRSVLLALSVCYLILACAAAIAARDALAASVPDVQGVGPWLAAGVIFLSLLLAGSILTKSLALARPVGFARAVEALVWVVHILLWPATRAIEFLLQRLLPTLWALELSPPLSGQEIRGILADEESVALMEGDEAQWVRSIFELGDTDVSEIMVPRIDMVGLEVGVSLDDAVQIAANASYTRLPVWEESQDHILGLLHAKDLLAATARGEQCEIRSMLRPVHFLPETKKIDEALREFRLGHVHLAVVVDEYGGTAGIVTLEDVLEEIVGEIRDEFDQEGELVHVIDAHSAVIDPRIDLDDLNELLGFDLPTEEVDTLAGLLYQWAGKVPARGDEVIHESLRFRIDRIDRQRICQVTLKSEAAFPSEAVKRVAGSSS